jgi:putative holliday junction resolvase
MRYLAIDLGEKRTGLAVGDVITGLSLPAGVIEVDGQLNQGGSELLMAALRKAIAEHGPKGLVIGLPLNMDGTKGKPAKAIEKLGEKLAAQTGLVVHFQDERLTSVQADWQMSQSGMTHGQKKKKRDALAAAAILEDFLIAQRRTSQSNLESDTTHDRAD